MISTIERYVKAVRRNHALEHATVAVLLARRGPTRLAGRASVDGFLIFGDVDTDELHASAIEALGRLKNGQASLAVTPLCGTNIAVAAFAAAATAAAILARRNARFGNAFVAAMFAVIGAQPLGLLLQQHVTTSADLEPVSVLGATQIGGLMRKVQTSGALDEAYPRGRATA